MIKRIVKMTFREDATKEFLKVFKESKQAIRTFPGCLHLELWRDHSHPSVFFTFSHWEHAQALENYRQSALFEATWARTKVLFADKPEAWSVDGLEFLP